MKKRVIIITLSILICILSFNISNSKSIDELVVAPNLANGYVYDKSSILSEESINYINNTNRDLQRQTKGQVAIVIIDSLQGNSLEKYAVKLFEKWQIGDMETDNGTLLLISIEDKKIRIETGYGADDFIPDAYSSRIIRNMVSTIKSNPSDFRRALEDSIIEAYNEILLLYENEYNIEINELNTELVKNSEDEEIYFSDILNIIFIIFIISLITSGFKGPRNRKRYGGIFYPSHMGGFRGGSFGSGGSFGGGFSGGGGSSGGGGASGGW